MKIIQNVHLITQNKLIVNKYKVRVNYIYTDAYKHKA